VRSLCKILSLLMALLAGSQVLAAPEIAGVWRGKLQVDPTTAMTVDFTFARKPDGHYSAVLNTPTGRAIRNVAAKAVSLQGDALQVDVPALSGTFRGTLKTGSIEGQWVQPGGSFPLVLNPYRTPQMSKADRDIIVGTWSGPLRQSIPRTLVLRFKAGEQGDLQGSFAVPEQGSNEFPVAEAEFASGELTFKLPVVQGEFTARYASGVLEGVWKQPGGPPQGLPVTLKKGEVAASASVLKFSGASVAPLLAEWHGTLKMKNSQGEEISLSLLMWFGTDQRADLIGFINSSSQGMKNVPVTEASLDGSKFAAKLGTIGAEYRGELSGRTIKGEWIQGPQRVPLTFTRQ
jgi:hypothetical protein